MPNDPANADLLRQIKIRRKMAQPCKDASKKRNPKTRRCRKVSSKAGNPEIVDAGGDCGGMIRVAAHKRNGKDVAAHCRVKKKKKVVDEEEVPTITEQNAEIEQMKTLEASSKN